MANVLDNTTNAKFIPTIIAQKALGAFAGYMNLARTVARDFNYTTATEGQVIRVPKRGVVTANSKAAGSEVTLQNPTATDISVTLDQHYEVTIAIDDVTKVLENQDTQAGYAEDGAIALAEQVEGTIAALHPSVTNTVTFDSTSATTQENSFLKVRERMALNKVPKMERKYAYLHPTVITRLLQIDRFTRADAYGQNGVIAEGALGRIGGIDVFESQLVRNSGSPVTYHNLVYTRDAFILASRPLPEVPAGYGAVSTVISDPDIGMGLRVVSSYDTRLQAMQITLDVLFGASVLDTRRVIELESN